MPRANHDALARSIDVMMVGLTVERELQEAREAPLRLDETDQVFQVPVDGYATGKILTWTPLHLNFEYTFAGAPAQRPVPYATPQFTWGFELKTVPPPPVVVACCVLSWEREEYDPKITAYTNIIGVDLGVGAFVPGYDPDVDVVPVKYRGLLHLNFGGFAAPSGMADDEV